MTHRSWLLVAAVLLLLLPILPLGAALQVAETSNYSRTEHSESLGSTGAAGAWNEYSSQTARFSFAIDDEWRYVEVLAGFGACCPALPEGSALEVVVTGPGAQEYKFRVDDGECHDGDRDCTSEFVGGSEWIILVQPTPGIYNVEVTPAGALEALPQNKFQVVASTRAMQEKGNDPHVLGNNIWWHYPDGTSKFVEDGGYLEWREAWPRIAGYSALAVVGWAGSVVFFMMYWRRRGAGESGETNP